MKRKGLVLMLIFFVFSCKEEEKRPEIIFSEDKMIEVLTEFQIAEATVRLGYHRNTDSLLLNDSIYSSIFRKLDISQVEFDTSFSYYSKRPKDFEKLVEKVITNLSKRAADLKVKEKPISKKAEKD